MTAAITLSLTVPTPIRLTPIATDPVPLSLPDLTPGEGGGAAWGAITGDPADQADLVEVLDAKADDADVTALAATVAGKASAGALTALATLVNAGAADLGALTTTAKGNLVAAINELVTALSTTASALAGKQDALGYTPANAALIGQALGLATLDASAKVPAAQLPSFVDDVIEAADYASLPVTGETGKIYITIATGYEYRWSGSAYVQIVASPGTTDALAEGTVNLYHTTARARSAISASGSLTYNATTGVMSYTAPTLVSSLTNDAGYVTTAGARAALSAIAPISYNSGTGAIGFTGAIASGTLTASAPAIDISQTWANAAVTFAARKTNITNTASAAGSLFEDWQVNGTSVSYLRRDGTLYTPSVCFPVGGGLEILNSGSTPGSNRGLIITNFSTLNLITMGSGWRLAWESGTTVNTSATDLILARLSAGHLIQRNGANAQQRTITFTYTDASNYSGIGERTTANYSFCGAVAAGIGTLRPHNTSVHTSASDPTATEIPAGMTGLWHNSGTGVTKLWANIGGTLKSVTLT